MVEPKTKSEGPLSVGAKTYIRQLAAQEIFGIDFEVSSKSMQKGIQVEGQSIELVNSVYDLALAKNIVRRENAYISGECDVFDVARNCGRDIKSSWSAATFPITVADCYDKLYEWQCRGYMALWDAPEWHVDYCLVDTPEALIGYEPLQMHLVSHIPERMRVTTWTVTRDRAIEDAIFEKVLQARAHYAQVIREFDLTHPKKG